MKYLFIITILALLVLSKIRAEQISFETVYGPLFDAIKQVETGGCKDPNNTVSGAGDTGAYQITKVYWIDAVDHRPELRSYGFQSVRDPEYAKKIMVAYWERYAKQWTFEELARLHHRGCNNYNDLRGLTYWMKVQRKLKKTNL